MRCVITTSGTIDSPPLTLRRLVLNDRGQADAVAPKNVGDVREDVRPVEHVEPQVVAVGDVLRRLHGERRSFLPDVDPRKRQGRAARGHVDQVGDDGRRRRHLARAGTGVPRLADRVPVERDHVERPAALRQRTVVMHQRRLHVHFELPVDQLGDGQQLDRVAQLVRVLEIGQFQRVDSLPRERADADFGAERQRAKRASFCAASVPSTSIVGSASA